jgi:iron complex transport system substrate-binding protein
MSKIPAAQWVSSLRVFLTLYVALFAAGIANAQVGATDTTGRRLTLPRAAMRVVSLSPHATELIAAAGGSAMLVGITQSCDFPATVTHLPRISGASGLNIESLIALKPDLVVAWPTGNRPQDLALLAKRGIPIFLSAPVKLDDIAHDITALGALLGTSSTANAAASAFRAAQRQLGASQGWSSPVRVFYQLGPGHLYTLNQSHPVMEIITQCGGKNVFAHLPQAGPQVSVESVIAARPEIVVMASPSQLDAVRAYWAQQPIIGALLAHHVIAADGQRLHRPTPRLIEAAAPLCQSLMEFQHARPSISR